MKYPEITIDGLQVKSLKKAKKLSDAIGVIEEECGIKVVRITFKNMFICPWINLEKLNRNEMDCLIRDIFKKIR